MCLSEFNQNMNNSKGGANGIHDDINGVKNDDDENDETFKWVVSNTFIHNMVKIRYEFGFDEPHPRHGRVNTAQALEYALHVLYRVVIPIHSTFFHVYYYHYDYDCCKEERKVTMTMKMETDTDRNEIVSPSPSNSVLVKHEHSHFHPLLQEDGIDLTWKNYVSLSTSINENSGDDIEKNIECMRKDDDST